MRNGRTRKEIWLSRSEVALIEHYSKELHIDKTAVMRVLFSLGANAISQLYPIDEAAPGILDIKSITKKRNLKA